MKSFLVSTDDQGTGVTDNLFSPALLIKGNITG